MVLSEQLKKPLKKSNISLPGASVAMIPINEEKGKIIKFTPKQMRKNFFLPFARSPIKIKNIPQIILAIKIITQLSQSEIGK